MALAPNPFAQQAQLEAQIRFNPQLRGLALLLAQARTDRDQGIAAQTNIGHALNQAALGMIPQTQQRYQNAVGAVSNYQPLSAQPVPMSNDLAAAMARDRAGTVNMLTQEGTQATEALNTRALDALAGAQWATQNLRTQYGTEKSKIEDQLTGTLGDEGAFAAQREGSLQDARNKLDTQVKIARGHDVTSRSNTQARVKEQSSAAAQRNATTQRGQDLSHADRQAAINARQQAAAQRAAKGKSPYLASAGQARGMEQITTAANLIKPMLAGMSPSEAMNTLVSGRPQQRITKDAKGNPLPNAVSIPAIKAVPPAVARAAYEIATGGRLTPGTVQRLHQLKLRVPNEWRPGSAPAAPPTQTASVQPGLFGPGGLFGPFA